MRSVTEEYYDNCPNCGAAVGADDRSCPYCGTSMVVKRTTTSNEAGFKDSRKVDIVSKAGSGITGAGGIILMAFLTMWVFTSTIMGIVIQRQISEMENIFGGMSGGFGYGYGGIDGFGNTAVSVNIGERLAGCIPFVFALGGAIALIVIIVKRMQYRVALNGPSYSARVLDHNISVERSNEHTTINAAIKVLANIDGAQTCILIKSDDAHLNTKYPVGSTVTIAGSGNCFVLKG